MGMNANEQHVFDLKVYHKIRFVDFRKDYMNLHSFLRLEVCMPTNP